jgi:hypothetical protein
MSKPIQPTTQQETQTQQGGEAMNKTRQETQIYFVTFPYKLPKEKAQEILIELRRRFQVKTIVFSPRPPSGRKLLLNINETLVIVTIPHTPKNPNKQAPKQEQENLTQSLEEGFTLAELAKVNKVKNKK